ncbi:MAG: bifunctional glutamine synthetase adenylyltransferase/deadenyltransferase, partial [Pseudomonadota bacterium]
MMDVEQAGLPSILSEAAETAWLGILDRAPSKTASMLRRAICEPELSAQLYKLLACSPFFSESAKLDSERLLEILSDDAVRSSLPESAFAEDLDLAICADSAAEIGQVLRRFRRRHMMRILWRDFCRLADTIETMRDMTLLAEVCISAAVRYSEQQLSLRYGAPLGKDSG